MSEGEQYILRGALVNSLSYGDTTRTPVDKANEIIVPANFVLDQNYPNPFNQSTIITYDLYNPEPVDVTVTIYDITGKEVKRLVDEKQLAGRHVVRWDGTDNQNRPVSSGVYVYQLRLGEITSVRKLLMTKGGDPK